MRFDFKNKNPFSFSVWSSAHKRNHVFVKFVVCFLLLGLAFRLFSSSSFQISPESSDPPLVVDEALPPPLDNSPVSGDFSVIEDFTVN